MMNQLLIKFEADYADEFDIHGFGLFSPDEWRIYKDQMMQRFVKDEFFNYSFGTNEIIEFESFDDFIDNFHVSEISEKAFDVIRDAFKLGSSKKFGYFP